ncbi:MAG: 3'-5' exonuclease [Acidimicrobiales bacterium]
MAPGTPWHEQDLLAFDLETTGVDPLVDVPVSYALVTVRAGIVAECDASLVDPGRVIPEAASAVHGITTEQAHREGIPIGIAVRHVADVVLRASIQGVPVVGMKLDYDLTMLDSCCLRETGRGIVDDGFSGPVLDALVIDRHFDRYRRGKRTLADLCMHYGVAIDHAHDASSDARAALDVVRAMCACYPELCARTPVELHLAQEGWHREWAESFSEWRLRKGLSPMRDDARQWPVAESPRTGGAQAAV